MKKRTSKEIFAETLLELSKQTAIDKITVKQIVEESGLSIKTFYNHFTDKYALMMWIEQAETERLHSKLKETGYSFYEYLVAGVRFYSTIKYYIRNAMINTHGQDSYEKQHAQACYEAMLAFILKRNQIESLPEEIQFSLKIYTYGLVEMFSEFTFLNNDMNVDTFVKYCIDNIPEKLKAYLL